MVSFKVRVSLKVSLKVKVILKIGDSFKVKVNIKVKVRFSLKVKVMRCLVGPRPITSRRFQVPSPKGKGGEGAQNLWLYSFRG